MAKRLNLIHKQFGKWTVLEYIGVNKSRQTLWKCECYCGNIVNVIGTNLVNSLSTQCSKCRTDSRKGCLPGNALEPGESTIRVIYNNYKQNARRKKLDFDLSLDDFKNLISNNCYYCGTKPTQLIRQNVRHQTLLMNGIDRKNPNDGYIKDNYVTCCKTCNYGKNKLSYSEWVEYLDRLVKYRISL